MRWIEHGILPNVTVPCGERATMSVCGVEMDISPVRGKYSRDIVGVSTSITRSVSIKIDPTADHCTIGRGLLKGAPLFPSARSGDLSKTPYHFKITLRLNQVACHDWLQVSAISCHPSVQNKDIIRERDPRCFGVGRYIFEVPADVSRSSSDEDLVLGRSFLKYCHLNVDGFAGAAGVKFYDVNPFSGGSPIGFLIGTSSQSRCHWISPFPENLVVVHRGQNAPKFAPRKF